MLMNIIMQSFQRIHECILVNYYCDLYLSKKTNGSSLGTNTIEQLYNCHAALSQRKQKSNVMLMYVCKVSKVSSINSYLSTSTVIFIWVKNLWF